MLERSAKTFFSVLFLIATFLAMGLLSPCIFAQKRKINPHQLTIFFTGDDNGQVKSCG